MEIKIQAPQALKPRARNPRTHSRSQIKLVADSIRQFGFVTPVLVDAGNEIVAGHARWQAALDLNLAGIPTSCVGHLSPAEIRAYVIADNRIAEKAGWDEELLTLELGELSEIDLGFDLTLTGFSFAEIDVRLSPPSKKKTPEESVPAPDRTRPAVTRPGDLWVIGNHRLLCGDATDAASYTCLMAGEQAQIVFSDPPFNVPVLGHVGGLGAVQHREFAMAAGEMSVAQFTQFLTTVLQHFASVSQDGAILYICIDWRHMGELLSAGNAAQLEFKNLCVWAKTNGGMGSLYRSRHELVFVFKKGTAPHVNNVELGKNGRYRTNVWEFPGVNSFGAGRDAALAMHPTVKPVALVAEALLDCSRRGGIVLDAFAGSGTTLVAAERTKRRGFGLELDPHYCDVILKRLEGERLSAVLELTGESFAEVAARRVAEDVIAPASEVRRD